MPGLGFRLEVESLVGLLVTYEKIGKAEQETCHVINPDWTSEAKHSHIPNLVNLPSAYIISLGW